MRSLRDNSPPIQERYAPVLRCERCNDELTVWWKGRPWCAVCDDDELFGDVPARHLFAEHEGGAA